MNLNGILGKYYDKFVEDYPGAAHELEFIFLKRELENLRSTRFLNDWDQKRRKDLEEWKSSLQKIGAWR